LILFGLQNIFTIFFRIIYSSVTIQFVRFCSPVQVISPLTGERCAQLLFRASLALQPALLFDKTARLIAGPENSLTMNHKCYVRKTAFNKFRFTPIYS